MAEFLRDLNVKNLLITEDRIRQIHRVFSEREVSINDDDNPMLNAVFSTIIRFDNKGYRTYDLETLLGYFNEAKVIDRLVFTLRSVNNHLPEDAIKMELWLDCGLNTNSHFVVESNESDWVNSSFSQLSELLSGFKSHLGFIRTSGMALTVQLIGLIIIFFISIYIANEISPHLAIAEPFFLSFIFALLVFSNFWGYINQALINTLHKWWPNIKFKQGSKTTWSDRFEKIVLSILGVFGLWLLLQIITQTVDLLTSFIK